MPCALPYTQTYRYIFKNSILVVSTFSIKLKLLLMKESRDYLYIIRNKIRLYVHGNRPDNISSQHLKKSSHLWNMLKILHLRLEMGGLCSRLAWTEWGSISERSYLSYTVISKPVWVTWNCLKKPKELKIKEDKYTIYTQEKQQNNFHL